MKPIHYTPQREHILPCVVIGTGVAGHAAMVWLSSYGVDATWIGQENALGGMLYRVHNKLVNVPGQSYADGTSLASALEEQLAGSSLARPDHCAHVSSIRDCGEHFEITLEGADEEEGVGLQARTLLLATGTRYGNLHFDSQTRPSPHITNTDSAFFSDSASRDGALFSGQTVAVIGGGDAAFENAITLAQKHDCFVHVLMRSAPKARRKFIAQLLELSGHVRVWPTPTTVTDVTVKEDRAILHLDTPAEQDRLEVACAFIRIGVRPQHPEFLGMHVTCDDAGHIEVDGSQRTSHPRMFAAGDITADPMRAIVASASEAAKAALAIAKELGAYTLTQEELDEFFTELS